MFVAYRLQRTGTYKHLAMTGARDGAGKAGGDSVRETNNNRASYLRVAA